MNAAQSFFDDFGLVARLARVLTEGTECCEPATLGLSRRASMLANFSYVNKLPRSFPVANRARDKRRYFLLRQVLNEKKAALANKTRTVLTFVCKWKQFCQDLSRHSNVTDVLVLYMSARLPRAPRAIPFSSNLSRLSWFGSIPSILVQSLRGCLKLDDLKLVNFRDLFVVQDLLEAVGPRLKILELRVARNATLRPTRSWYRHFFTAVAVHLRHLYCCPVTFDHELIAALPPNLRTITMVDSGLSRRPLACCVLHFALALNDGSCLPNVVALPNCFVRLWRDYQYIMDPIVLTCLEEDCPGKVQCHMVGLTRYGGMKFDEVVGLACDTAQRAVRSRRRSLGIKNQDKPDFGQAYYDSVLDSWEYTPSEFCPCCAAARREERTIVEGGMSQTSVGAF